MKTNFVLAWLGDEELRRRVGRMLNKGEQLHALRRFLFYANEGHVRHRTPEQQTDQALCLAIVVNAIIVWNTVYTSASSISFAPTGSSSPRAKSSRSHRCPTNTSTSTATTPSTSRLGPATIGRSDEPRAPPGPPARR